MCINYIISILHFLEIGYIWDYYLYTRIRVGLFMSWCRVHRPFTSRRWKIRELHKNMLPFYFSQVSTLMNGEQLLFVYHSPEYRPWSIVKNRVVAQTPSFLYHASGSRPWLMVKNHCFYTIDQGPDPGQW